MEEFSQQTMFSGRLEMASHLTQTMLGNMVSAAVEAIRTPRSIIHLLLLTVHPKPVGVRTLFHVVGILKVSPADGVAPRAKMNQQRARRFKSAKDKELAGAEEEKLRRQFELEGKQVLPKKENEVSDSNIITPGTDFMYKLSNALRSYISLRLSNDSGWRDIKVILSDANVPGEGEHKIMSFIRQQRNFPSYDPNTRHCLYGLDVLKQEQQHANCQSVREMTSSSVMSDKRKASIVKKPYQLEEEIDAGSSTTDSSSTCKLPNREESQALSLGTFENMHSQIIENTKEFKQKLKDSIRRKSDLFKNGDLGTDKVKYYTEGLLWVLLYYFSGPPSWTWFYPFHYAPFASDLKGLGQVKPKFEKGSPFLPIDTLMAVLPPRR
ncbi:hypothetical protein ACE6H2_020154 [Prunus campanulata]